MWSLTTPTLSHLPYWTCVVPIDWDLYINKHGSSTGVSIIWQDSSDTIGGRITAAQGARAPLKFLASGASLLWGIMYVEGLYVVSMCMYYTLLLNSSKYRWWYIATLVPQGCLYLSIWSAFGVKGQIRLLTWNVVSLYTEKLWSCAPPKPTKFRRLWTPET